MVMVMVMVMVMDANEGGRTFHGGDCGIPSSYLNISDLLESKTFEDSFNKAAHPVESAWEGFKFSQFIDKYCGRIFDICTSPFNNVAGYLNHQIFKLGI